MIDTLLKPVGHATLWLLKVVDRPVVSKERARTKHPRGVAMLLALVTIALMSSAVVEFAYISRVNLSMASNERDRLKSYYLARSAVNISSLMLSFQVALQKESGATDDDMGQLISRAMRRSNFQIYQYVDLLMKPFHSGKLETPVGGIDLEDSGVEGFGNFTGEFTATVRPEAGRISINDLAKAKIDNNDVIQLCALFLDPQYDDLFSRKDEYGETLDRQAILQNLIDFVDPDQEAVLLNEECAIEGSGGDEGRIYSRDDKSKVKPRNALLTHVDDLFQVHGIDQAFMDQFGSKFTVYDVGRPNINVAEAPVFYSVLCRNVNLMGNKDVKGFGLCAREPLVAAQVLWFAMALDGVRQFFDDPLSVLLAYVGTQESKLLPSAKKGQPVAFLSVGQFPRYIEDFKANPALMAQFIQYSPFYQQFAALNPDMAVDPLAPNFPQWTIDFDSAGLTRSVSTSSPQIFRISASGQYGTTESRIEVIVDMGKTIRRLPDEQQLEEQEEDTEDLRELKKLLREEREAMPKGRVLYWREF
jgi:general secretion pathway protein K